MNWGVFKMPTGPHAPGCSFSRSDLFRQARELGVTLIPLVADLTELDAAGNESEESIDREAQLVLQGMESLLECEFFRTYLPLASEWIVRPDTIFTAEILNQRLDEFRPVMARILGAKEYNGCARCQAVRINFSLIGPVSVTSLTRFVDLHPQVRAAVPKLAPILNQLDIWLWNAQMTSRAAVHAIFPEPEGIAY